jgi:hypothetical protein
MGVTKATSGVVFCNRGADLSNQMETQGNTLGLAPTRPLTLNHALPNATNPRPATKGRAGKNIYNILIYNNFYPMASILL